jgi:glycoprotein endo-alpha-1,2-mannosidase
MCFRYSYFASDGFTAASTARNWRLFDARLFVPAVGPGYNDTLIRPWNSASSRSREGGVYYDRQWAAALPMSNMVRS